MQIDRLTGDQVAEDDDSGIPDLVEVIRLQTSGPTEAARAIRKKLYETALSSSRNQTVSNGLQQEIWQPSPTNSGPGDS